MIWAFRRRGQELRCEIRRESDGEVFEFVMTHPDGTEEVERFVDSALLVEHSVAQLEALVQQGWKAVASPGADR